MEIVVPAVAAGPRIEAAEELTPQQLFTLYAEHRGLAPEAAARGCEPLRRQGCGERPEMTEAIATIVTRHSQAHHPVGATLVAWHKFEVGGNDLESVQQAQVADRA